MMLVTVFFAVTGDIYYTVIFLSVLLSLVTLALMTWEFFGEAPSRPGPADSYTLQGLHRLLHFRPGKSTDPPALVTFLIFYTREGAFPGGSFLSIPGRLPGGLNRLDTLLMFLPMLLAAFSASRAGGTWESSL